MALSKFNFNSFDVTTVASAGLGFNASANGFSTINPGSMTLIKTITASSDSAVNFVHGSSDVVLDSTYPIYLFKIINVHVANNDAHFRVNFSIDSGSNYNVAKTTTYFRAQHTETGSSSFSYNDLDQANGTDYTGLSDSLMNANDASSSGEMYLFNPSSTTFVKHFLGKFNAMAHANFSGTGYSSGYMNTTSAINAVSFKHSSGNIDSGTFKLYGIKDS